MASTQGVFGQVIHFVYTWLPKTTGNYKRKRKDFRQSKKPENISQKTSSPMLAFMRSSQGLPSTPNASKVLILRALPNTCKGQEELSEDLSPCNLQVVGYKFLSNEKKMSKRSALKKWLRRKANDVFPRNIYCDGQFGNSRHILCSRELFECSLKLDGKPLIILFEPQTNPACREILRLSVKNNPRLHWFCLTLLCDWSWKLAPLYHSIRCETETPRHLIARVFPRFGQFGYFEFTLALNYIFLFSFLLIGRVD